jgi:hypothetical protein
MGSTLTAFHRQSNLILESVIMKSILALTLVTGALLTACGSASAERPLNLAGTTWTVQANREVVQLVISTQGGPGAPGADTCRHINGTIGIASIHGWYCWATGRIHFLHNNLSSGVTVRTFSGHVSDEAPGQPLYMAGTMTVEAIAFGDLGEYNFSATDNTPAQR